MDAHITWNLILSIIAFPSLAWFIKRELDENRNAVKENQVTIRQEMKEIKTCMMSMKREIDARVHKDDCEEESKIKWNRLNHHTHDAQGRVVIP